MRFSRRLGSIARNPELLLGILGMLSCAAFAGVPSIWYDEAASVTSARRSFEQLWAELHNVDLVHGLYFAGLHLWFDIVGYSPLTLRFPSAIAIGLAAALVVSLGRMLVSVRFGAAAGVVFVALPRVQWAGSEGRPYAFVIALSVLLAVLVVRAARSTAPNEAWRRRWVAYTAASTFGLLLNIYLALGILSHGVTLLWNTLTRRQQSRGDHTQSERAGMVRPVLAWTIAALVAVAAVSPFVLAVVEQSGQVSWLPSLGKVTVRQVFSTAWFGQVPLYAACAWTLMCIGVAAAIFRRRSVVERVGSGNVLRLALPMVLLPTGVLLIGTAFGHHLYTPKYACLSLPFVAMLITLGLRQLVSRRLLPGLLILVLLASAPLAVAVKRPHFKQDSTWSDAATFISEHRGNTQESAGVIFGSVYHHPTASAEIIRISYPAAFTGMRNLNTNNDATASAKLWNTTSSVRTLPARIGGEQQIWFVGGTSRNVEPHVASTLGRLGYKPELRWQRGAVIVTLFTRG